MLLGGETEFLIDPVLGDLSTNELFFSPKGEDLSRTGVLQSGVEFPLLIDSTEPFDL